MKDLKDLGYRYDNLFCACKIALEAMRNARDTWEGYEADMVWTNAWDFVRQTIEEAEEAKREITEKKKK